MARLKHQRRYRAHTILLYKCKRWWFCAPTIASVRAQRRTNSNWTWTCVYAVEQRSNSPADDRTILQTVLMTPSPINRPRIKIYMRLLCAWLSMGKGHDRQEKERIGMLSGRILICDFANVQYESLDLSAYTFYFSTISLCIWYSKDLWCRLTTYIWPWVVIEDPPYWMNCCGLCL